MMHETNSLSLLNTLKTLHDPINTIVTLASSSQFVGIYFQTQCHSRNDTECFKNIQNISNYIGVSVGFTLSIFNLMTSLFFICTAKTKPKKFTEFITKLKTGAGVLGLHVVDLMFIAALHEAIYLQRHPGSKPPVEALPGEFAGEVLLAVGLAILSNPEMRYKLKKLYERFKHYMMSTENPHVMTWGKCAKVIDVISSGVLEGYPWGYGLVSNIQIIMQSINKNINAKGEKFPDIGYLFRLIIIPSLFSLGYGALSYFYPTPARIDQPAVGVEISAERKKYLKGFQLFQSFMNSLFFIMLLFISIFLPFEKNNNEFNLQQTLFNAMLGSLLLNVILNVFCGAKEEPVENPPLLFTENPPTYNEVITGSVSETASKSSPQSSYFSKLSTCCSSFFYDNTSQKQKIPPSTGVVEEIAEKSPSEKDQINSYYINH